MMVQLKLLFCNTSIPPSKITEEQSSEHFHKPWSLWGRKSVNLKKMFLESDGEQCSWDCRINLE